MSKRKYIWIWAVLAALAVQIGGGVWLLRWLFPPVPTVTSENGTVYSYFVQDPQENHTVKSINFSTATREQLQKVLEPVAVSAGKFGEITTPEQAACRGASVLEDALEVWTHCDCMGVLYNETAKVWVVHGMMENAESDGSIGVAVLDADTGAVLGITTEEPQYRM